MGVFIRLFYRSICFVGLWRLCSNLMCPTKGWVESVFGGLFDLILTLDMLFFSGLVGGMLR